MSKFPTIWQQCLEKLSVCLPDNEFNTWIRPIHCDTDGETLKLYFQHELLKSRFSGDYAPLIQPILAEAEPVWRLQLVVGSLSQDRPSEGPVSSADPTWQHYLNQAFTFDAFVKGGSNEIAMAAAVQVAKNPGSSYNPLVIYGDVGLGKTHLMHAIGHEVLANRPDAKVCYIHSERFVSEMIRALQRANMEAFKHRYRSLGVLLLDDIQFFAKKERSQEELFHTFNALLDSGQQIVITSDRYPKELTHIEDRLKSRFAWGLSVSIDPPDLETRVAILLSKAESLGKDLPEDVAFFIAREIESNVRELEGALRRVMASAEFQSKAISLEFAMEVLRDLIRSKQRLVTIDGIVAGVAAFYNLTREDLLTKTRKRHIARARQVAMLIAYENTDNSYPQIAGFFGGMDHTTVLYACQQVRKRMAQDIVFKEEYDELCRKICH